MIRMRIISYYQQNYEQDQIRVRNTFRKLKDSQHTIGSMKEITNTSSRLQLSTVIEIVSMNDDVVAIMLLDNNVLWRKRLLERRQEQSGTNNYCRNTDGQHS